MLNVAAVKIVYRKRTGQEIAMEVLQKVLLLLVAGVVVLCAGAPKDVAVIPHDTHPGFSIKKFSTDNAFNNYRLLENGFSEFFTMLEDGSVMTTSDLTPLVNRPVSLVVLEESPNSTSTHTLHLYVLDRRNMLRFGSCNQECTGHVRENLPAGSRIMDVPLLQAVMGGTQDHHVTYTITAGNTNGDFRLLAADRTESNDINDQPSNVTVSEAGVYVVTSRPLDRERVSWYVLTIEATDRHGISKAETRITISVDDDNDNSPTFNQKVYRFIIGDDLYDSLNVSLPLRRFSYIGKVEATDADGDKVAYRLTPPNNLVVIVPQTGDLLLIDEPKDEIEKQFSIEAHDLRTPSRTSLKPAQVFFHYKPQESTKVELDLDLQRLEERELQRTKRRVTRAVRPTKRIEFTESDGDTEGRNVFQLEKETDRETFKIRDENAWVTVEPNGVVRVKKKWDYEELGPEKTIDFWVTITNAGNGGKFI